MVEDRGKRGSLDELGWSGGEIEAGGGRREKIEVGVVGAKVRVGEEGGGGQSGRGKWEGKVGGGRTMLLVYKMRGLAPKACI